MASAIRPTVKIFTHIRLRLRLRRLRLRQRLWWLGLWIWWLAIAVQSGPASRTVADTFDTGAMIVTIVHVKAWVNGTVRAGPPSGAVADRSHLTPRQRYCSAKAVVSAVESCAEVGLGLGLRFRFRWHGLRLRLRLRLGCTVDARGLLIR